jgi:NADPH2:quinone reductase
VEIGDGVIGFHAGMKVYVSGTLSGTYAEYCLCSPGQVFPLPEGLDFNEGACLGVPYFTAARALFTLGNALPGETVLVHGASGGVGLACLQMAAGTGLPGTELVVYGTAGSPEGQSLVCGNGAVECFNHTDRDYPEAIRETIGAAGIHLIVEMRADLNLETDLKLLAPGGRIVVVGSRGRIEIAPRDIMASEARILGLKGGRSSTDDRRKYSQMVKNGVNAGHIKPPVSEILSLEDAGEAHNRVMNSTHRGSIVLDLTG